MDLGKGRRQGELAAKKHLSKIFKMKNMYLNYCTEGNKVLGSNTFFFFYNSADFVLCQQSRKRRYSHYMLQLFSYRLKGLVAEGMGDGRLDGVNCTITRINKTQYALQLHGRELAAAIPKLEKRKLMSCCLPPRISRRLLRS